MFYNNSLCCTINSTSTEEPLDVFEGLDVSPKLKKKLLKHMKHQITSGPVKINAVEELPTTTVVHETDEAQGSYVVQSQQLLCAVICFNNNVSCGIM